MGSISSKIAFDYTSTPATMGGVFGIASQISDFPRLIRLEIFRLGPIGLEDSKVGFPKIIREEEWLGSGGVIFSTDIGSANPCNTRNGCRRIMCPQRNH
ncbi:hypothetical protein CGRA01v4_06804 [Colletotrichum graminicola]|nr:hypothetical protein CGRA01v4_06804 [Colletotrichum graminicola]